MRLNSNNIGELNSYERGKMSSFEGRGVQIYRSNSELTDRDGGTTIFQFDYEGDHEFFYPSTLGTYKGEP